MFGKKVILFGTGDYAKRLVEKIPWQIEYCVDNDQDKWGQKFFNIEIVSPEMLLKEMKEDIIIIIGSSYYGEITNQLNEFGLQENKHFFSYESINTLQQFPAGHFYSPIPSKSSIKEIEGKIYDNNKEVKGVYLNVEEQLRLLKEISIYYKQIPYFNDCEKNLRYFFNNKFFDYSDAIIYYCMLCFLKPKKLIEVGSGFSSALAIDVNELNFKNEIKMTFIEPYPDRLNKLLKDNDSHIILEEKVQNVSLDIFKELDENDILFIDSSHTAKAGSDVNYLIFEVLPRLKKGVYVHFHDVFWPFEYPKEWIYDGRSWNEVYLLRAFLQYNNTFSIKLWNQYLAEFYEAIFTEFMPQCLKNTGGSLWLRKEK